MEWLIIYLGPLLVFWLCVHALVCRFNERFKSGRTQNAPAVQPIALWEEVVLIGLPLIRYGILILGQMTVALAEKGWDDNKSPKIQAFRRWYPESFVGSDFEIWPKFLQTFLILSDTLSVTVLLILLVRVVGRFLYKRGRQEGQIMRQAPDPTVCRLHPTRQRPDENTLGD